MTERSTAEILRAARERIADPERWGKGAFAYDGLGQSVGPWREAAVCWCARGAVHRECGSASSRSAHRAEETLTEAVERLEFDVPDDAEPIAWVNDHHDHEVVLALFDRAIELAEESA